MASIVSVRLWWSTRAGTQGQAAEDRTRIILVASLLLFLNNVQFMSRLVHFHFRVASVLEKEQTFTKNIYIYYMLIVENQKTFWEKYKGENKPSDFPTSIMQNLSLLRFGYVMFVPKHFALF